MAFFKEYGEISGQILGLDKCKLYAADLSPNRSAAVSQILGFGPGSFPFIYLGIPIFKGRPKSMHLKPIADKIRAKLSTWKGSLLSIMGKVQLVNSIITGDVDTRKVVTVAWKRVCSPTCDGGLGLKSFMSINKASILKLSWEIMHSSSHWATFMRARFTRKRGPVTYHIYYSCYKMSFEFNIGQHSLDFGRWQKNKLLEGRVDGSTIGSFDEYSN